MTRPCDCQDMYTAIHKLNEQGIKTGQNGIELSPSVVILTVGPASIKIPMSHFKLFAEWYLEDQIKDLEG